MIILGNNTNQKIKLTNGTDIAYEMYVGIKRA
jgi:hypothetical protein